jgi:hypothetical protein
MKCLIEVASRPTLQSLAEPLLRVGPEALPYDETSLRAALIAETLRIGLFELYRRQDTRSPVHPLKLRSWVRHKLAPVIPDVLEAGQSSFREVLSEGRGSNLEFLGDAVVLAGGYLCPAPTRLVQVGTTSHLLVSGVPTDDLGSLGGRVVHSALGRRVEGLSADEVRLLEEYLGSPGGIPDPEGLITSCLSRSQSTWQPGRVWEAYQGSQEVGPRRLETTYGFAWGDPNDQRGRKFAQADFHGTRISIWREPLTENFYHYWISAQTGGSTMGVVVSNTEWKQVCLAIDALASRRREATFVRDSQRKGMLLSLGFPPFEALYRALHALGARFGGWRQGMALWEVPVEARTNIKRLLERVGVTVRVLGD